MHLKKQVGSHFPRLVLVLSPKSWFEGFLPKHTLFAQSPKVASGALLRISQVAHTGQKRKWTAQGALPLTHKVLYSSI